MIQTQPVFYSKKKRMFTGNYLRWVFLILLCIIKHATLLAQTFQVAGGIPYFPAYTNAASVTLSPIPTGAVIYDKSKSQLQLYTGSAWVSLCSANIPSTSNVSASFRIVKGIPVLSVTNLSTTATAGATYLKTTGGIYVGDGSAWNALGTYMNKTNVTTTNPARMGAVAGAGSAIVIPVLSTAPTATAAGAAYFDATTANLKVYSGTAWLTVGCNLPIASSVNVSGTLKTNNTVTGTYTYTQADGLPEGTSIFRWYSANNSSGGGKATIGGATSKTYSIASGYAEKYIAFGVAPVTNTGLTGAEVLSTWKFVQWQCGDVLTRTHTAGAVAPQTVTISYGTVYLAGTCWITRNLGATQQAAYNGDQSSASAGWYWQFGNAKGYTGPPVSPWPTATSSSWSVDPCNSLLGSSWHVPSKAEWESLLYAQSITSGTSLWNNLKIHRGAGSMLSGTGAIDWRNTGRLWSSTNNGTSYAYRLYWYDSALDSTDDEWKAYGLNLRCRL